MSWIFLPELFLVSCVAGYLVFALYSRGKNDILKNFNLLLKLDYIYWSATFSLVLGYLVLVCFRFVFFNLDVSCLDLDVYLYSVAIFLPHLLFFQLLVTIMSFFFFLIISFNMTSFVGNLWNRLEANLFMVFIIFSIGLLFLFDDLMLVFILVETYNICIVTILVLDLEKNIRSLEGALRYFVFSAFSSALLLLGISYLYWNIGTFSLNNFRAYFVLDYFSFLFKNHVFLLGGLLLVLVALVIKMGLAPFHSWLIEVYEGASYVILFWLLNIVKSGFFLFFISFYFIFHNIAFLLWPPILWVGLCSLVVGCFGALYQIKLKTLLGFSSILNFGFLITFVVLNNNFYITVRLVLFYLIIYLVSMFGIFVILFFMSSHEEIKRIEDVVSLRFYEGGVGAGLLTLFLVGLAGFPPLGLFYSKFFIVVNLALQSIFSLLVAIITFTISLIGVYYYLRLIKLLWYDGGIRVLFFRSIQNVEIMLLSGAFYIFSVFVCAVLFIFIYTL